MAWAFDGVLGSASPGGGEGDRGPGPSGASTSIWPGEVTRTGAGGSSGRGPGGRTAVPTAGDGISFGSSLKHLDGQAAFDSMSTEEQLASVLRPLCGFSCGPRLTYGLPGRLGQLYGEVGRGVAGRLDGSGAEGGGEATKAARLGPVLRGGERDTMALALLLASKAQWDLGADSTPARFKLTHGQCLPLLAQPLRHTATAPAPSCRRRAPAPHRGG